MYPKRPARLICGKKNQHPQHERKDNRGFHAVDGLVEHQRAADDSGGQIGKRFHRPGSEPVPDEQNIDEVQNEG